jgi:hypothetical protein
MMWLLCVKVHLLPISRSDSFSAVLSGRLLIIFVLLAHFLDIFSTHRFRVLPFTASPSCCPFGFPFGRPSRTERFTEYNIVLFFRSVLQLHGTLPAFQLSCSPGVVMKLASPNSGLLTQPSNERLAFFGLTERVRLLFSFNL